MMQVKIEHASVGTKFLHTGLLLLITSDKSMQDFTSNFLSLTARSMYIVLKIIGIAQCLVLKRSRTTTHHSHVSAPACCVYCEIMPPPPPFFFFLLALSCYLFN
jgi:hypothetical protein